MSANDHDDRWTAVRDRVARLDSGSELVTPLSERPFRVEAVDADRLQVRFLDSGEERTLHREQFAILAEGLADRALAVADLPPGVEPHVAVLTLLPDVGVEDGEVVHVPGGEEGAESPYLVSPAEARTRPERLHDDAVLLADALDRLDAGEPRSLETDALTDLYVLLSDVQRGADRLRQAAREALLDRLGPDQELHGLFGTVRRTVRERRRPRDDETVFDVLDAHDVPREWVLGVDPDRLDVVLAVTDVEEADVYDREEQVYVQKTDVEAEEKYTRLQGLADRLEAVAGDEAEDLRADLLDLEARLDEALSA